MSPSGSMPPTRFSDVTRRLSSQDPTGARPRFSQLSSSGRRRELARLHRGGEELSRPLPERIDGRYAVRDIFGVARAMSDVYIARDTLRNEWVVVKVASDHFDLNISSRAIMREFRALSLLDHPNIVRLRSIGRWQDKDYLVMDYVQGTDLFWMLQDYGRLDWQITKHITMQLCEALQMVHDRGIVHSDLKLENIIVSRSPGHRTTLLDFGLAKLEGQGLGKDLMISPGTVVGTFPYMAPETFGAEQYDYRADIYSLGVIMYEVLVGGNPFSGYQSANSRSDAPAREFLSSGRWADGHKAASTESMAPRGASPAVSQRGSMRSFTSYDPGRTVEYIMKHVPPPPSTWADIPGCADDLVMQAIAKDPRDRFNSMAEMKAAIQSCE